MHYLGPKSLAPRGNPLCETGEPRSFLTVKLLIADCDKVLREPY